MLKGNHNCCSNKRVCREIWNKPRLGLLLPLLFALCAGAATNHRVVLLHSFGRDFAPFDAFSRTLRTELALQMSGTVVFYDFDLETARFETGGPEDPSVNYLMSLFAGKHVDLIVPIGGPAARFAQKHRQRLFQATPMLIAATDRQHLQSALLTTNDSVVSVANDNRQMIASILKLLPATTNIAVIIGNSPLEKFWLAEWRREFQPFSTNVNFEWLSDLSYAEMQKRVSSLAPCSAIFYGMLYIDAEGVPYPGQQTLTGLHAAANAPMFGLHDSELGFGIVGGRLMGIEDLGRNTAIAAARILHGEPPSIVRPPPQIPGNPIYDWRELNRWGISEKRLPAGSIIRFQEPGFWQRYKAWMLLGVGMVCALLALFHFRHAAQLRVVEEGRAALTQQMILSQEDERRRIAGELHDGLGQVLVIMKNQLGLLPPKVAQSPPDALKAIDQLARSALQALNEVRAISQALRPAALEQVGLTNALDALAREVSGSSSAAFSIDIDRIDDFIPAGSDINLYRIVQEGLNNVLKHSHATHVILEVKRLADNGLYVSIFDDGAGFDLETRCNGAATDKTKISLGLVNMTERAKLLGGNLDIKSSKGIGTRITLTLPLKQKRHQTMPDSPKNDSDSGRAAVLPPTLGGHTTVS